MATKQAISINWIAKDEIYKILDNNSHRLPIMKHGIPTMFSSDGEYIYLSTPDIIAATDDITMLNYYFDYILDSMFLEVKTLRWSCARLQRMEEDYLAIWGILNELQALPDGYECPEHCLEQVWRKLKITPCHSKEIAEVGEAKHPKK